MPSCCAQTQKILCNTLCADLQQLEQLTQQLKYLFVFAIKVLLFFLSAFYTPDTSKHMAQNGTQQCQH